MSQNNPISEVNNHEASNGVHEKKPGFFAPRHDVEKQMAAAIKFNSKIGMYPFDVTDDGRPVSSRSAKITCLMYFSWAALDIIKDLRNDYHFLQDSGKYTLWTFAWLYHLSLLGLLICAFYLIWWLIELLWKAIRNMYRIPPPVNNKTYLSGTLLRLLSVFMALQSAFGGFTVFHQANDWSPTDLLAEHEDNVILGFLPHTIIPQEKNDTLDQHNNLIINATAVTNITLPAINGTHLILNENKIKSTDLKTNASANGTVAPVTGNFTPYPFAETVFFGIIGLLLCIICEVVISDSQDMLLLYAKTTWAFTQELDVSDLYLTFKRGTEEPLEDEAEIERKRILARATVRRHDQIMDTTTDFNAAIMVILPALLLACTFKGSNIVQLIFEHRWFTMFYYFMRLMKLGPTFYYSLRTADQMHRYRVWTLSKSAMYLLDIEFEEFDRRQEEMNLRPIGVGSGFCYINGTLLISFLGLISSNFLLILQYWDSTTTCECKVPKLV